MGENLTDIASTFGVVITALGGLEFLKWLFGRKHHKKKLEEEAKQEAVETSKAKIEANADQFHYLQERIQFAESQLLEKEKRFNEQTEVLRDCNRQLLEKTMEIGQLNARIAALEAERAMKLCERRGCKQREPQSGY